MIVYLSDKNKGKNCEIEKQKNEREKVKVKNGEFMVKIATIAAVAETILSFIHSLYIYIKVKIAFTFSKVKQIFALSLMISELDYFVFCTHLSYPIY